MNLSHRQDKMQAKRKNTPYRDFVMEIASWIPLNFYKNCGVVSRYPVSDRVSQVISMGDLINKRNEDDIVGQGYDNNQSFLEQVQSLMQQSSLPGTWEFMSSDNSSYSDCVGGTKNAYLSFLCSMDVENILYSFVVRSNVVDCISSLYVVDHSSNVYQSCSVAHSYNVFYSSNINNCANIWFSSNLHGCQECVMCDGLENVSYHINNIGYSKEEYFAQKSVILAEKQTFDSKYENINRHGTNIACNNCVGDFLVECDDVTQGLLSAHIKTGHNVILSGGSQACEFAYDTIQGVAYNHSYGTAGMALGDHYYSCAHLLGNNMYYSTLCSNCSFCLGCVGLKDKSYCILNKQYTKEEWYQKVDEIFESMDTDGTLGEFFPAKMNPFYFNDTAAYLIDPSFTKEEVVAKGYLWRDEPIKVDVPEWMEVVESKNLGQFEGRKTVGTDGNTSDKQWTIDPVILKKTIRDEEGNIYRVIKMEYDFLVKYGLPLPRKHWLTRMKENFRIH